LPLKERNPPDTKSSECNLPTANELGRILLLKGLETWAVIGEADLAEALGSELHESGPAIRARAALVVAFPYDPRPALEPGATNQTGGPEPYLRIAAFASCHHYTALARLLKATARDLTGLTGYSYTDFRVAVNSRLPEKRLAERAGLGCRGRSDLLLSHAYGPACVLGVLFLPFEPLPSPAADSVPQGTRGSAGESPCGSCRACAEACPGQAIDDQPGFHKAYRREACLQHWMSTSEEPPVNLRPALEGRLYGCDACILACPLSVRAWRPDRVDGTSPASRAAGLLQPGERRPGSLISASFLKLAGDEELKTFFRKTALGLSWFGPGLLRRNAALGSPDIEVAE
jgi:epoxyqueuosine reductase QueG